MIKEEVRSRIFKRRQLKYIQMTGVLVDIDRNIIEALHDLGQRGSGTTLGTIERCQAKLQAGFGKEPTPAASRQSYLTLGKVNIG